MDRTRPLLIHILVLVVACLLPGMALDVVRAALDTTPPEDSTTREALLLATDPLSPMAPEWDLGVVRALGQQGKDDETRLALVRTAATYESSGAWAQANPGRYAAARDAIEEVFRGYVIDCRAMAKASQAIA